jgi:hypothetical protein
VERPVFELGVELRRAEVVFLSLPFEKPSPPLSQYEIHRTIHRWNMKKF